MSFSNLTNQLSKLAPVVSMGVKTLKIGASPISATVSGLIVSVKFFASTLAGRLIIVACISGFGYMYLEKRFTAKEAGKWEAKVEMKNQIIERKVVSVNRETEQEQALARATSGFFSRILNVVIDGIYKVQAPHPIESETIDLINETRGKGLKP